MVICLERGADLHMAQLMPLPLTIRKIQIEFTFLVLADPGCPGQRAVKWVCVLLTRLQGTRVWHMSRPVKPAAVSHPVIFQCNYCTCCAVTPPVDRCVLLHLYVYVSRPVKLQLLRQMSVAENSCTICADNVADTALVPCQHRYAPPTALSFTAAVLLSAEVMLPFLSVKNPAAAVHECCCFCVLGNIRKL